MKRLLTLTILLALFIAPLNNAQALEPKTKAFAIICTYGTVGGALLGFASLAFGADSRVIAQGASLGLYAGIAFGAYVITSHRSGGQQTPEYEDNYQQPLDGGPPPGYNSTFGGQDDGGGGGFGAPVPQEEPGGFFGSPERMLEESEREFSTFKHKKSRVESLPIYFNLMNVRF